MKHTPDTPSKPEHSFIGRHSETGTLRALLEQVKVGRGTTVLVTGPAGIGKTSLLRWFEDETSRQRVQARWGYCLPGIGERYFPLKQIFHGPNDPKDPTSSPPIRGDPDEASAARRYSEKGSRSKGVPVGSHGVVERRSRRVHLKGSPSHGSLLLDYLWSLEREALLAPLVLLLTVGEIA